MANSCVTVYLRVRARERQSTNWVLVKNDSEDDTEERAEGTIEENREKRKKKKGGGNK